MKARTIRFPEGLWDQIATAANEDDQDAASWLRETAVWRLAGRLRGEDVRRLRELELEVAQLKAKVTDSGSE